MNGKIVKATHGAPDRPIRIGDLEIPCYVLEDDRRVLVQGGLINALDISHGGSGGRGGDRLAKFVEGDRIKPFIKQAILDRTGSPILFKTTSGNLAHGYEATLLADLCDAVLEAKERGMLQKQQEHIAIRCRILMRAFAQLGIIALVDEATGYQEIRDRVALQKILDAFISKELLAWAKRFPDEFYQELFRLRGWQWKGMHVNRPSVVGHWTNDLVYERLAPGVLEELRRKEPPDEKGNRKHHLHRWLTEDIGHPRLAQHLHAIIALMKAFPSWGAFHRAVQRAFPKIGETIPLNFEEE